MHPQKKNPGAGGTARGAGFGTAATFTGTKHKAKRLQLQRALSVTDGRVTVGAVARCGRRWIAMDAACATVGTFATQAQAVRALPVIDTDIAIKTSSESAIGTIETAPASESAIGPIETAPASAKKKAVRP